MLRIGHGYDVHRFIDGSEIMLGGIAIPHTKTFAAHSDGDVALHAITDAILGALALGDIGKHFPDTDAQWAGADSAELLSAVWEPQQVKGWTLVNADVTIVAQRPKIGPHVDAMRNKIAKLLGSHVDQVNVKATTTEKLGFEGREEGVSVHAVVLLEKRS
jgi:2-C-methyl-D-erythritol 2,4-cyclodiphosphate synthase